MIELHYWPTPNGYKITMFLEEVGLDYQIHPVDISAGDQFKPEFLAFSPNNRMPSDRGHAERAITLSSSRLTRESLPRWPESACVRDYRSRSPRARSAARLR